MEEGRSGSQPFNDSLMTFIPLSRQHEGLSRHPAVSLSRLKGSKAFVLALLTLGGILTYALVFRGDGDPGQTNAAPSSGSKISFKATDLSGVHDDIELSAKVVQAELDRQMKEKLEKMTILGPYKSLGKENYADFAKIPLTPENRTGLVFPPRLPPGTTASSNQYPRAKAAFVVLIRNSELNDIRRPIRQIEDRVNRKFGYPWIFLNDEEFIPGFKELTSGLVSGEAHYGVIPKQDWEYPTWIDQQRSEDGRARLEQEGVVYGGSLSYRHMCRFNSGLFFNHPLLKDLDYYWRVEPHTQTHCDVDYDPFLFVSPRTSVLSLLVR